MNFFEPPLSGTIRQRQLPRCTGNEVVHKISLFGLLFGVWLLLSGFLTPFFLGLAVICCALVTFVAARMDRVDGAPLSWSLKGRAFAYFPWLAWQVLRANIDVTRLVWRRDMDIDPRLEWVPAGQKSDLGVAIYANSITLTPGTVSTSVEPGRILVHALTAEGIAELRAGAMDVAVRDIEA